MPKGGSAGSVVLDPVDHESLRVVDVPPEGGRARHRELVGLPKRDVVAVGVPNGGAVAHLEANLVRVAPDQLREVATDQLDIRRGRDVADLAADDLVEGDRNAEQRSHRGVQVDLSTRARE